MTVSELLNIRFNKGSFSGEYDCGQNTCLELYENVDSADFDSLLQDIRSFGYPEVQSSEIDNFCSFTFFAENKYIIVTYDKSAREVRLISDPKSAELNTSAVQSSKNPYRLWQFEVDHSLIDCGMCYIVQFSDFSFFIIDSAHTYSVNDDVRLFSFLRKHTPQELPVRVSGWYFSHGHVDHIGKFLDVLMYNNEIKIEGLYFNFVPSDHFSSDSWMVSDKAFTDMFMKEVEKRNHIPVYKLHSGQYFYMDNVRFDVLCTHEDVYPASLENYNDSSTVIMMTIGNDKVCFPGDGGGEVSKICERRFPSFLKCDIVQVSHHGHFGTSEEFYNMTDSDVALFATTYIKFEEEYHHYKANEVVCEKAKHVFVASDGTVEFEFPLTGSRITVYPDETFESFEGVYNLWGYEYSDEYKEMLRSRFEEAGTQKFIDF